jgi:uncharacterized membrane protein YphA (DoxX/SURF4 family)
MKGPCADRPKGVVVEEIALGIRFCLSYLFLLAGVSKVSRRSQFSSVVKEYQIGGLRFARFVTVTIPFLELSIGMMLLLGVFEWLAGLAAAVLLVAFAGVAFINLMRGRRVVCGCLGSPSSRISGFMVTRNLLLAVASAELLVRLDPRAFIQPDGPPAGAIAQAAMYSAALVLGVLTASEVVRVWRLSRSLLGHLA